MIKQNYQRWEPSELGRSQHAAHSDGPGLLLLSLVLERTGGVFMRNGCFDRSALAYASAPGLACKHPFVSSRREQRVSRSKTMLNVPREGLCLLAIQEKREWPTTGLCILGFGNGRFHKREGLSFVGAKLRAESRPLCPRKGQQERTLGRLQPHAQGPPAAAAGGRMAACPKPPLVPQGRKRPPAIVREAPFFKAGSGPREGPSHACAHDAMRRCPLGLPKPKPLVSEPPKLSGCDPCL